MTRVPVNLIAAMLTIQAILSAQALAKPFEAAAATPGLELTTIILLGIGVVALKLARR